MTAPPPPESPHAWLRRAHSDLALAEAFTLTQYAVQTRYPGEWEPVTEEEARSAVETAARVLVWVETQVGQ